MSAFVFSIRHEYAELIYSGRKTVELRSVLPANPPLREGDAVALYETKPIGAVTGSFTVGRADVRPVQSWELCRIARKACVKPSYLREHMRPGKRFSGQLAVGVIGVVRIADPARFARALRLSDYGLAKAPQSWCRAKREPIAPKEGE